MRRISISIVAAVAWAASASVPARAETINVSDDHGGSVAAYDARWAALAARGVDVKIVGPCQSACTEPLAHIPYDRICVTPQARFGFHQAHLADAYRATDDAAGFFLEHAIGARLRDMLWAAIFPNINFAVDPVHEVVRRSVAEYVSLVDQHPNVLRFMLQGRFPEQSESTVRALNEGREITMAMAEMFNHELREMELDPAALQLAASATFGSASAATDWWLGPDSESPRRMPSDDFVKHLTTIMLGTINGTAELLGIDLDQDRPIREAVPRRATVG